MGTQPMPFSIENPQILHYFLKKLFERERICMGEDGQLERNLQGHSPLNVEPDARA